MDVEALLDDSGPPRFPENTDQALPPPRVHAPRVHAPRVPAPRDPPAPVEPSMRRVTVWDTVKHRKLSGNSAPRACNLERYLQERPDVEVYDGQDRAVFKPANRYRAHEDDVRGMPGQVQPASDRLYGHAWQEEHLDAQQELIPASAPPENFCGTEMAESSHNALEPELERDRIGSVEALLAGGDRFLDEFSAPFLREPEPESKTELPRSQYGGMHSVHSLLSNSYQSYQSYQAKEEEQRRSIYELSTELAREGQLFF